MVSYATYFVVLMLPIVLFSCDYVFNGYYATFEVVLNIGIMLVAVVCGNYLPFHIYLKKLCCIWILT